MHFVVCTKLSVVSDIERTAVFSLLTLRSAYLISYFNWRYRLDFENKRQGWNKFTGIGWNREQNVDVSGALFLACFRFRVNVALRWFTVDLARSVEDWRGKETSLALVSSFGRQCLS